MQFPPTSYHLVPNFKCQVATWDEIIGGLRKLRNEELEVRNLSCLSSSREDGSVIYLYNCFWPLPEQPLSGPRPVEVMTIFYCLIWDSPNLKGQVPEFVAPRNRVAQLYPRALGFLLQCVPLTGSPGKCWFTKRTKVQYICKSYL
jgi:hypothetical protein